MEYAGFIIPPKPPTPDFEASREKLQKLGEAESGQLTKEEFNKMKQELEAEYLATFKKTVAQHEVFLQRIATHPSLKNDRNFHVFLEYEQELNVRSKNTKERLAGIFSSFQKSGDELLLSNTQKDVDEFFECEKHYLIEYNSQLKDACVKSDKMTSTHKQLADNYIKLSACLVDIASLEHSKLETFLNKLSDTFEKMRRIESRVANDEDLKMSDTLRYHMRDTSAAKDLLYRRLRWGICFETFLMIIYLFLAAWQTMRGLTRTSTSRGPGTRTWLMLKTSKSTIDKSKKKMFVT